MGIVILTRLEISLIKFRLFINKFKNNLRRVKENTRRGMKNIELITSFKKEDEVWLHISKERMQGEGKKLKPIHYGPFKIIKKVGNNAFQLDLPSYMRMYSVVNVENLRLYEPPLIDDQGSDI